MPWDSELAVELIQRQDGDPDTKDGRGQWRLVTPLPVPFAKPEPFEVPAGATTDFASIPRGLWNLLPPDGPWLKAAVAHDHLYRTSGLNGRYTRAQADAVLRDGMKEQDVPAWKRWIIYSAVRTFGGGCWGT